MPLVLVHLLLVNEGTAIDTNRQRACSSRKETGARSSVIFVISDLHGIYCSIIDINSRFVSLVSVAGMDITATRIDTSGTGPPKEGEGPALRGLTGQVLDVKAQDASRDKDFNVADLDKCTVTM